MEPKFIEVDRETLYLLPPSVQGWLLMCGNVQVYGSDVSVPS
jgi:hypothetical protein